MYILIYTLLILCMGLGNKIMQAFSGEYGILSFSLDLPMIVFTYFGLIALWGRLKHAKYFTQLFWRVYFIALMLSIFIVPFFDSDIQAMIKLFGSTKTLIAYSVMVLLMLPYYWGLYSYVFNKNSVWRTD